MSGVTHILAGASSEEVKRVRFRRSAAGGPDPNVLSRQSRIALMAFQACGTREAACSFMNDIHPTLGGRPIEIAGGSEAGFASVRAALPSRSGQEC